MWDVFLSYSQQDRALASSLEQILEEQGFSVWWDREIISGQNWLRSIEDAIGQARCVVVLWTPRSVSSEWVREEATLARGQDKLVPVHLENAEVPLSFRLIQTADLRGWDGNPEHAGIAEIVAGIRRCLDRGPVPDPSRAKKETKKRTDRWQALAWLAIPTIAVALAAIVLMNWPVAAKVAIAVTANRVQFHTPADSTRILLESARASTIHMRGFRRAWLSPSQVWIRSPGSASSWLSQQVSGDLAWSPSSQPGDETLSIQSLGSTALELDRLYIGSAGVTMEAPQSEVLTVELDGLTGTGTISLPEEFEVEARHARPETGTWPAAQSLNFRIRLASGARLLQYEPGESRTVLQITFPGGEGLPMPAAGLKLDRIEFLDFDATNNPVSSISGPGKIEYLTPAGMDPVVIQNGDALQLRDLRDFRMREMSFAAGAAGLRLKLEGVVGRLSSGSPDSATDRRFSQFDLLWRNQKLASLFIILTWLITTLVALRTFLGTSKSAVG